MGLAACSSGPAVWYEEGTVDEADVVHLDISERRITIFIDGEKVAIRHPEVLMAPGTYAIRVVANSSFDRNPDTERYNQLIADLKSGVIDAQWSQATEIKDHSIETTVTFTAEAGKRYFVNAELITGSQAVSNPNERPLAEFVVYIGSTMDAYKSQPIQPATGG